jgi:chemotaxis protein methyltransferase WspC
MTERPFLFVLDKLRRLSGLTPTPETVAKAMARRMKDLGATDEQEYLRQIFSDNTELQQLVELLVVPETWFFRDREAFAAATSFARNRVMQGRRPVRILSLPCSTGEEPYSMAMALTDASLRPESFHIEGMDISEQALELARKAVYGKNSFRGQDQEFRALHFDQRDDRYALHREIRMQVRFSHGNLLAQEPVAARWDIIFCRNLLIYFDEPTKQAAIRRLAELLQDDGMLLVGYAEAPVLLQAGFELTPDRRAFAMRKAQPAPNQEPAQLPAGASRATSRSRLAVSVPAPAQPVDKNALPAPGKPVSAVAKIRPSQTISAVSHGAPATSSTSATPGKPASASSLEAARTLADSGRHGEARKEFEKHLAMHPHDPEAYFMLGLLAEREQDMHAAEVCLRRAVYLDPDHYDALCHLALLAEARGDAPVALSCRRRAERVYNRRNRQGAGQ